MEPAMRRSDRVRATRTRPAGKTLVMFALLLPALLGMVGLVIDGGMLQAAHRQTQNAADAAALAAALDLMRGQPVATAVVTANAFLDQNSPNSPDLVYNEGGSATNALNHPPLQGPHAGN